MIKKISRYLLLVICCFIGTVSVSAREVSERELAELIHELRPEANYVYSILSIIYLILIFMTLFNEKSKMTISNKIKVLITVLIFIILILIGTALYVQFTSEWAGVGNLFITGIQGRYFIPICFLLIFIVNYKRKFISDKLLMELFLLLQIPTILTIFIQFV